MQMTVPDKFHEQNVIVHTYPRPYPLPYVMAHPDIPSSLLDVSSLSVLPGTTTPFLPLPRWFLPSVPPLRRLLLLGHAVLAAPAGAGTATIEPVATLVSVRADGWEAIVFAYVDLDQA